jgi:hypothetical protein
VPVTRVTKVELITNLQISKAPCLTIPLTLVGCADEAIE